MATQLQIVNFCDTGFQGNITEESKQTIIALAMYQRPEYYNLSNLYVKNYKNNNTQIIQKNIGRKTDKNEHFIENI